MSVALSSRRMKKRRPESTCINTQDFRCGVFITLTGYGQKNKQNVYKNASGPCRLVFGHVSETCPLRLAAGPYLSQSLSFSLQASCLKLFHLSDQRHDACVVTEHSVQLLVYLVRAVACFDGRRQIGAADTARDPLTRVLATELCLDAIPLAIQALALIRQRVEL